jgi:hypothetical protein
MSSNNEQGNQPGCSADCETPPQKKAKVWYKQAFNDAWLSDPELKDWIKRYNSEKFAAVCTVCGCTSCNVNKTALLAHKNSSKHAKNFEAKSKTLNINTFFQQPKTDSLAAKVAKAELVLTAFMAEHNTPFLQADHLVECCKIVFPDSEIAQKMSLKRTKVSYVMQQDDAYYERQAVVAFMFTVFITKSLGFLGESGFFGGSSGFLKKKLQW